MPSHYSGMWIDIILMLFLFIWVYTLLRTTEKALRRFFCIFYAIKSEFTMGKSRGAYRNYGEEYRFQPVSGNLSGNPVLREYDTCIYRNHSCGIPHLNCTAILQRWVHIRSWGTMCLECIPWILPACGLL